MLNAFWIVFLNDKSCYVLKMLKAALEDKSSTAQPNNASDADESSTDDSMEVGELQLSMPDLLESSKPPEPALVVFHCSCCRISSQVSVSGGCFCGKQIQVC